MYVKIGFDRVVLKTIKVYESESSRGTEIMDSRNAHRIKNYVVLYFKKYGSYSSSSYQPESIHDDVNKDPS